MRVNQRITIGFLIDYTESEYHFSILKGILDCAEKRDVNLFVYEGGALKDNTKLDLGRSHVYDFVNTKTIDGLIILADSITNLLTESEIHEFYTRFTPLPIVNINKIVGEYTSVLSDTDSGMNEMMEHLVVEHGYTKIAFVTGTRGSIEAEKRFGIYKKFLTSHSLPYDDQLVVEGDFVAGSGIRAVKSLIERKVDFEVIFTSNDEMAIGAIKELQKQNIKVPEDVVVVGYDDINNASCIIPELTTVRQPMYHMGWASVEKIIQLLEGHKGEKVVYYPSKLIIRKSCGCDQVKKFEPVKEGQQVYDESEGLIESVKQVLLAEMSGPIDEILTHVFFDETVIKRENFSHVIIDTFTGSLSTLDNNVFLSLWESFLGSILDVNREKVLVSQLTHLLFSRATELIAESNLLRFIEFLWRQINEMYSAIMFRLEKQNVSQLSYENWLLNTISDDINILLDEEEILNVFSQKLKKLGLASSFLSLFHSDDESCTEIELVMGYDENHESLTAGKNYRYETQLILPDEFLPQDRRYSYIIEYLNYTDKPLGLAIFEINNSISSIYGTLRRDISNILHGSSLVGEIENQRNNLSNNIIKLRKVMGGFIQTLGMTLEMRDPYTAGHQRRVSELARSIAQILGLDSDQVEGVRMASLVHDIGKIFVPAEILNKPGKLLDIEFNLIKNHPNAGYEILRNIEFPWPLAEIVLQHHERFDGTGYPNGLMKDDILIEARIVSVADVVEAITSMRPYRQALGLEVALAEVNKNRGKLFDPDIVEACEYLFLEDGFEFK